MRVVYPGFGIPADRTTRDATERNDPSVKVLTPTPTVDLVTGIDSGQRSQSPTPETFTPGRIAPLLALGIGDPRVRVAVIDGPVDVAHEALQLARFVHIGASTSTGCQGGGAACQHGTSIAGLLCGAQTGICPGCTVLLRPILADPVTRGFGYPQSIGYPQTNISELTGALVDALGAGADVINLSVVAETSGIAADHDLRDVLDAAARLGVLVVAATANSTAPTHSPLLAHRWVLPVVACDETGRRAPRKPFNPIRRDAIGAPGRALPSLVPGGGRETISGTSAAAAVVTGTAALLRSHFPQCGGRELRRALLQSARRGPDLRCPPLLDAWAAHQHLAQHRTS